MARFGDLGQQYFDDNGDPLGAGKIYIFETGTTTPKTTYSDSDLVTPNAHPVVLDAAGRQPDIFFDGAAKGEIRTTADVSVEIRDPVGDFASATGPFTLWVSTNTYAAGEIVIGSNGLYYVSLAAANTGNDPTSAATWWTEISFIRTWNTNETYDATSTVRGSDGFLYSSQQAANTANDPVADFTGTWWLPDSLLAGYTHNNVTLTSPILDLPQINDASDDHQYVTVVSELAADRNVTLPLLGADDEYVFKDHAVTLTNKTLTNPTINAAALSGTLSGDHTLSGTLTLTSTLR